MELKQDKDGMEDARKIKLYADSFSMEETDAQKSTSNNEHSSDSRADFAKFSDLDQDSVYFVNRKDKSNRIVVDANLERGSPTWDEWTSEESSTISVLCASDVNKEASKSDAEMPTKENLDFPPSNSFDFISSSQQQQQQQHSDRELKEARELENPKYNYKSKDKEVEEKDKYNSQKLKQTFDEQDVASRQYSSKHERDNSATKKEFLNISSKKMETQRSDHLKEQDSNNFLRPRDYSPSYSRTRDSARDYSPRGRDYRTRDYSPNFRTASPFRTHSPNYAIDAYLGLKDKDSTKNSGDEENQNRENGRSLERDRGRYGSKDRDMSSYDRRQRNTSGRKTERREDEARDNSRDADIKEDLCSSLQTIKNASMSPEAKKYSEDYLSGLKRLTAVESNNSQPSNDDDRHSHKNPFPETTDDSKSWYRSKISSDRSEVHKARSPRSMSPLSKENLDTGPSNNVKQTSRNNDVGNGSELPGFLAKTPLVIEQNRLEKDIHFESEFPTFSAYLKRTYGQTYQYRNRDSSDEKDLVRDKNIDNCVKSSCEGEESAQRKNRQSEMDQRGINDRANEYSAIPHKTTNKEQTRYKEVEHKSRKSNYSEDVMGNERKAPGYVEDNNRGLVEKPQTFIRGGEETVYEVPGQSECLNKQIIKNSATVKCKVTAADHREASPTIDLLQQSFESLQSAINNKEIDLSVPADRHDPRRFSPSPERFPEAEERLSDSSRSRSRSRTKKRTIQSQPRSRDSSQKLRLKEIAPTFYEAKYNSGHDPRTFEPDVFRQMTQEEKMFSNKNVATSSAQNAGSPSLSEIEGIYKGSDQDFGNVQQKYSNERYPMDFNDEDINIMKKFIHHKNEELYMDVETFKKLYVQNRVMEMKREASLSRRSSVTSIPDPDQEREQRWLGDQPGNHRGEQSRDGYQSNQRMMSSSGARHPSSADHLPSSVRHTPIEYGSPSKRNAAVQMQVMQP